jgi:predicted MPP superfamily phosphohydrolase
VRFAVFLAVFVLVVGGLHFYVWTRLIRDPALPQPWMTIATVVFVALFASVPLSFSLRRSHAGAPHVLYLIAMIWLGLWFLLVFTFAATDLLRLFVWIGRSVAGRAPLDPGRRQLLRRAIGGVAAATASGLTGLAIGSALSRVRVKPVEVPLAKLPRELDGFTIAQITDVHVGPTIGRAFMTRIVDEVNALDADVVAITGDLVDGPPSELGDAVSVLKNLKARRGVFFITGNHEYYTGVVDEWFDFLRGLGIRVLVNERVAIDGLDLAGVSDYSHDQNIPAALEGRDASRPLVLLAHQPRAIREAAAHGVDLQLSGHTHGGQIWPWRYMVLLQQPFVAGLAKEKDTWIYVSKGTGYWGPPMRLFTPAEITRVVLRSASS